MPTSVPMPTADPWTLAQTRARLLSDPIYAKVWKLAGLPGRPPPVYSAGDTPGGVQGFQPNENRGVYLAPEIVRGMKSLPFSVGRDKEALQVLLHEYAHVAQPRVGKMSMREPGADLWALNTSERVGAGIGVPRWPVANDLAPKRAGLGYPDLVSALVRDPAWKRYVMQQQFGKRT